MSTRKALEDAVEKEPGDWPRYLVLADCCEEEGDQKSARAYRYMGRRKKRPYFAAPWEAGEGRNPHYRKVCHWYWFGESAGEELNWPASWIEEAVKGTPESVLPDAFWQTGEGILMSFPWFSLAVGMLAERLDEMARELEGL